MTRDTMCAHACGTRPITGRASAQRRLGRSVREREKMPRFRRGRSRLPRLEEELRLGHDDGHANRDRRRERRALRGRAVAQAGAMAGRKPIAVIGRDRVLTRAVGGVMTRALRVLGRGRRADSHAQAMHGACGLPHAAEHHRDHEGEREDERVEAAQNNSHGTMKVGRPTLRQQVQASGLHCRGCGSLRRAAGQPLRVLVHPPQALGRPPHSP
jgi:hypothetical protein